MSLSLYAIGGLGLTVAVVGGYAALEHSWRKNSELQVAIEQEANKKNEETIALMKDANELAGKIALELSEQLGTIAAQKEADDAAVTELVDSDEEIRKYLATPIPDRLKCLRNRTKCPDRNANSNPQ